MYQSIVTQKGQITIPIELRKELNIKEGNKVIFIHPRSHRSHRSKLSIAIFHSNKLIDLRVDLRGFLPKPKKSLTIEEMNEIIESKK